MSSGLAPQLLKRLYVRLWRLAGGLAEGVGLLAWLDRRAGERRAAHWLRSLFAIHDIEAMVGLDVPWWTYRASDLVAAHLAARPGARVVEFGSGASTCWLARRAARVVSIEHHPGWFPVVAGVLARDGLDKVDLRLIEADSPPLPGGPYASGKPGQQRQSFRRYAHAADDLPGPFDLIVIDGRARLACLGAVLPRLAADGLVVFDNARRARYRAGLAELIRSHRLAALETRGLTPSLPYPEATLLLARDPARLESLRAVAGP
ncbi:class I SAM-dependent methyltransferase [Roseospirillum parvum]|uniref:Methyltransferase domain-containing protein n=1 Tax=Roseospirillum parvum TaxID=83401 RepID=A0A1G8CZE0_9PROT|nr:class I SAM-dependent methyltransferase [Roseospirillum parvum]SDH50762.1 Methyltransferase domain-containing protein [Roseospirillum parvum]